MVVHADTLMCHRMVIGTKTKTVTTQATPAMMNQAGHDDSDVVDGGDTRGRFKHL